MAGIKGMGKPSDISVSAEPNIDDLFESVPSKSLPALASNGEDPIMKKLEAMSAPGGPNIDDLFTPGVEPIVDETPQNIQDIMDLSEASKAPEPSFMETMQALPTRFRASFAKTDKEKRSVLDQTFGAGNVKKVKDDFLVKKDGKWKKFDPSGMGWDLINDVVDFSREGLEEVVTSGATIAGAGAAGVSLVGTGGVSLPAAIPAVGMARAAGAVAGGTMADLYQAYLGIPRDPERNAIREQATNAALGAFGGAIGDVLSKRIAERAARKATENIQSTDKVALNAAKDILKTSEDLKDLGLIRNVDGFNIAIMPSQAKLMDPNVREIAEDIASMPQYNEFINSQKEMLEEGFDKLANAVSNYTGAKPEIGARLARTVDSLEAVEGKFIGEVRELARNMNPRAKASANNFGKAISELAETIGYKTDTGDQLQQVAEGVFRFPSKITKPSADDLSSIRFSESDTKDLQKVVNKFYTKLFNNSNELTVDEIDGIYQQLSKNVNILWKRNVDPAFRYEMTKIKDAIRDDYTEMVGKNLGPQFQSAYQRSLDRFSSIKGSVENIQMALKNDAISSNALASTLFSKGKDSLQRVQATKNLLRGDDGLWRDIVGHHLNEVVARNTKEKKINWAGVGKEIEGLGDEVMTEMFGNQKDSFKKFIKLSEAIDLGAPAAKAAEKNTGLMKNLALAAQSIFAAASSGATIFSRMDKEKKMYRFLSEGGLEDVLAQVPKHERSKARAFFEGFMEYSEKSAKLAIPPYLRRADETFGSTSGVSENQEGQ